VKDFAQIAAPLYNLLKKNVEWSWSENCQRAFEDMKTRLVEYRVLRHPQFDKRFYLYTDASNNALGGILGQIDEDGKEYVCAYASRLLKAEECNYGITEKECLGVLWAIKHFRIYLYGQRFTVITDHAALSWLMNINEPTGKLARWSIYLQTYDFEVIHKKGSQHLNVDVLSRPVLLVQTRASKNKAPVPQIKATDSTDIKQQVVIEELVLNENRHTDPTQSNEECDNEGPLDPYEDEGLLHYLRYGRHIQGASKKQCKRVMKLEPYYRLHNTSLFHKRQTNGEVKELPVPTRDKRSLICERAHLLGHFQVETTLKRVQEKYYWQRMKQDVETIVRNCLPCKRHQKQHFKQHPAIALPITGLMDRIGIDLIGGLPETPSGYVGILVITEYLSKYPCAYPVRSKTAVESASKLLIWISTFGAPKEM
jgi:hypothetical protein